MRKMPKILIGVLVGVVLAAGGAWLWLRGDACLGRCGAGTICQKERCVAQVAAAAPVAKEKVKRTRRSGDSPAAPEIKLQPGDEKMVAQGDALGRPEHIDLSEPDARELSQEDLDQGFRGANSSIERCITDSLGDAPLESGRVEVGFRVEKSGQVSRVRVEAPALLQRQGLTKCIRGAVASLRFPSSGGSSVVTYPFELK
jgi:hypothetical protein